MKKEEEGLGKEISLPVVTMVKEEQLKKGEVPSDGRLREDESEAGGEIDRW